MQMAAGVRVGGFTVIEQIAHGGSGQVWRAHSEPGDSDSAFEDVAVKVFDRPEEAALEVDRLRAAASVPGVVQLVDHGPGWLATRWVDGRTLAHLIQTEGPLGLDRTVRLMEQLAATVDELHAVGLVHGDLSPSNAIVDLHDRLTVVDLGSPVARSGDVDTTLRVEVQTTPRYASPEVASGADATPASDRYALALIAYEALTGASPFPPVSNPMAMLGHHVSSEPVPVSETAPSYGTRFDELFERALSKSPSTRPPEVQIFVAGLQSPRHASRHGGATRQWRLAGLAAVAAAVAVIGIVGAAALQRSSPEWAAGNAAGVPCNLVTAPGFEEEQLPDNWYRGDPDNSITLVPGAGIDGSTAQRVGAGPQVGLVGQRVPIDGGERYHFSAWVRRQGEPERSGMWLEYETEANVQIEGVPQWLFESSDEMLSEGRRVTRIFEAPAEAAWAVPTFFKDASGGSVLVDEVVFGPASACGDVPT